jgi:hypothetical protein
MVRGAYVFAEAANFADTCVMIKRKLRGIAGKRFL